MSAGVKKFLELGCGDKPVVFNGEMEFGENNPYIGLDRSKSALSRIDIPVMPSDRTLHASFRHGFGERLPFADRSMGTVFMANIMGDKGIDHEFLTQKRILRMDEWIATKGPMPSDNLPEDHPTILAFLIEANRVLEDDGELVILETLTPPPQHLVAAWLRMTGFQSAEDGYVTGRNPSWGKRVAPYLRGAQRESNLYKTPPFMQIATKKIVDSLVGEEGLEPSRA